MRNIFDFIVGWSSFELKSAEKSIPFNDLKKNGIYSLKKTDSGFRFKCSVSKRNEIKHILNQFEYESETYGLLTVISKFIQRFGILAGLIVIVILDSVFSGMIWNVDISSENDIDNEIIKNNLEALGVYEGARKKDIDVKKLYIDYMLKDESVSWVHLNITGTSAVFEVSKREFPQKSDPDKILISNIVASCDGVIERMDVYSGGREVQNGESVTKGQLLISSFFETRMSGYILRRAKGTVIAYTEPVFEMMIPKKTADCIERNAAKQNGVSVLSHSLLIDKTLIDNENTYLFPVFTTKRLMLFGYIKTPFLKYENTFTPIKKNIVTRSYEDCNKIYMEKLKEKICELKKHCEIVNYETGYTEDSDYYIFKTRFSCKESIGEEKTVAT